MKAALISQGSVSSKWTLEAMKKYFKEVDDINLKDIEVDVDTGKLEVLHKGIPLPTDYNCIFAKGSFRYMPLLRSITIALHHTTYMPIKPEAFEIGHDKFLTQLVLQKNNIPMPKAYLTATSESAKKILETINYPIIMKFPSGTQGKGVMYAESFATANSMLDALTALNQPFIIQEYVETDGTDTRAFVVGNRVVAAYKRVALTGEKRANIHAGGIGEPCTLPPKAMKIAVASAKAVGAEICAIDLLEDVKGHVVLEVNLSPGLQGITQTTKIDVADKIAKYLYEKAKTASESKEVSTKDILEEMGIEKPEQIKEIITNLDFRGDRILLPKAITNISKLKEEDEVTIDADEDIVIIKKFIDGKRK